MSEESPAALPEIPAPDWSGLPGVVAEPSRTQNWPEALSLLHYRGWFVFLFGFFLARVLALVFWAPWGWSRRTLRLTPS